MRWLLQWALALGLWMVALPASAAELTMADGSVISGELVAPNDDGTVIRRTSGGLSPRISWDRFSQATLTELANDPALKILVEAYIDAPESPLEAEPPPIVVQDPPGKVDRPARKPGLFAVFRTPAGWFIALILLAANFYAAYEVAVFRNYPFAAVIGTSAVLPILGPVLFLCMPNRVEETGPAEGEFDAPQEVANTGAQDLAAAGLGGSALSLSAGKAAATSGAAQHAVYKAADTEFNRAFFERSFPLFFRLTRADSDKDTVLALRTSKGEVVAVRISRISSNEIGLITQKGQEVQLRFGEISEVHVRGKNP